VPGSVMPGGPLRGPGSAPDRRPSILPGAATGSGSGTRGRSSRAVTHELWCRGGNPSAGAGDGSARSLAPDGRPRAMPGGLEPASRGRGLQADCGRRSTRPADRVALPGNIGPRGAAPPPSRVCGDACPDCRRILSGPDAQPRFGTWHLRRALRREADSAPPFPVPDSYDTAAS
jgi:hypothetical protein